MATYFIRGICGQETLPHFSKMLMAMASSWLCSTPHPMLRFYKPELEYQLKNGVRCLTTQAWFTQPLALSTGRAAAVCCTAQVYEQTRREYCNVLPQTAVQREFQVITDVKLQATKPVCV